jgi:linoleoyl-CoA desaturase
MLVSGYAWWMVLLGYVTMHFCIGLTLATVFQLAHVVEQTAFPLPDDGRIAHGWSAHQLLTTANFASQSRVCNFLFGGLNQQVEHHLFAKVCHIHYPDLSRLVREVAKDHGLPYYENPTLWSALVSHVRTLRALGNAQLTA